MPNTASTMRASNFTKQKRRNIRGAAKENVSKDGKSPYFLAPPPG